MLKLALVCSVRDPAKAQAVQALFEQYNAELRDKGSFPAVSPGSPSDSNPAESPQTRVWVLYFLAQHYDCLG